MRTSWWTRQPGGEGRHRHRSVMQGMHLDAAGGPAWQSSPNARIHRTCHSGSGWAEVALGPAIARHGRKPRWQPRCPPLAPPGPRADGEAGLEGGIEGGPAAPPAMQRDLGQGEIGAVQEVAGPGEPLLAQHGRRSASAQAPAATRQGARIDPQAARHVLGAHPVLEALFGPGLDLGVGILGRRRRRGQRQMQPGQQFAKTGVGQQVGPRPPPPQVADDGDLGQGQGGETGRQARRYREAPQVIKGGFRPVAAPTEAESRAHCWMASAPEGIEQHDLERRIAGRLDLARPAGLDEQRLAGAGADAGDADRSVADGAEQMAAQGREVPDGRAQRADAPAVDHAGAPGTVDGGVHGNRTYTAEQDNCHCRRSAPGCGMTAIYRDPGRTVAERVVDLIPRMTVAEKIGQLCNRLKGWDCWIRSGGRPEPSAAFRTAIAAQSIGSIYGVLRADPFSGLGLGTALGLREGAALTNRLQREALDGSRLGIPLLFSEECLHGQQTVGATTFPSPLALACAWDEELMRRIGAATARELRAHGGHMAYAPVCDLALDPRWSRCDECLGEDPLLAGRLAAAMVEGLQGGRDGRPAGPDQVGATLKHFTAHGASLGGFTSGPVSCGPNEMRRLHLRPFRAAVDAGALALMACHVAVDGVPCAANRALLTGILREEWGFPGFVVADGNGIDLLGVDGFGFGHESVSGPIEAASLALRAGVDSSLWDEAFDHLDEALALGLVAMDDIDRACARILEVKFRLGLFERPFVDEGLRERLGADPHRRLAREAAVASLTLVANRGGLLPLAAAPARIAVIGPNGDRAEAQLGDYVSPRERATVTTVRDGLRARFPDAQLVHAPGCGLRHRDAGQLAAAVAAAQAADLVVLVLGGSSNRAEMAQNALGQSLPGDGDADCGEGVSKADVRLWPCQRELAAAIAATGTPVVAVLIQGRPHAVADLDRSAGALLCAWSPGPDGGEAIAAVIAGDCEPQGRLAVAIPGDPGSLPATSRRALLARQRYVDAPGTALYPFGHGLGYTTWRLGTPRCARPVVGPTEMLRVHIPVANTGARRGSTVVQAYAAIPGAIPVRPHRELAGWTRVEAGPGETVEAIVEIDLAALDLAADGRRSIPVGLRFGFDSEDRTGPSCGFMVSDERSKEHSTGASR
jgi:beta-glucosidase